MTRRIYFILFIIGLIPPIVIAQFQPSPGYLDSDYYFAGGIQLVMGRGFTEPYLWNYLDGTTSLPHPSHSYWMPLASIISALGMWWTGSTAYSSGRLFFFLIAGFIPPLTAALAYRFSGQRSAAIVSGLLAIFSVYHAPFMGVTDNFGLYMLFGALYFLCLSNVLEDPARARHWAFLGLLAGFMNLARTDGLLWLGMTSLLILWYARKDSLRDSIRFAARSSLVVLAGFLLIMGPWYARNWTIYGTLMAPGGSRALWLDHYDQTFIYPPTELTMDTFLSLGWREILADRLWALKLNLQSGFAAHGGIILSPFILMGIFVHRKDLRVRFAALAWAILFLVMTFIFPFAGARGAFFHAGAALQPIWWTLAPLGLDAILSYLRRRNWGNDQTVLIFRSALVMIAAILTVFVVYLRVFGVDLGWGEGEEDYPAVEQFLADHGVDEADVVIVRNAPGYYLETGRSAISIPYGGADAILEVARQFDAQYLVLEPEAVLEPLKRLFNDPENHTHFIYLGELDDTHIYKIEFE
jgi:hypothetical protein